MQILVFGMHRSGTSVVSRLLNMMGAYFAPEGTSTGANQENPKGFWERRDVRDLNDLVLRSVGADWHRLSNFSLSEVPEPIVTQFETEARKVILAMDSSRPWFLKEPRFCVLAPLWLKLLEFPVCVFVHRSPLEVARSLEMRNGFPIIFGLALWERYNSAALNDTLGLRRIQINHAELLADPVAVVQELARNLEATGVRGLELPSNEEILAFLDPSLYRAKEKEIHKYELNATQRKLRRAFTDGKALLMTKPIHFSEESQQVLVLHDRIIDIELQLTRLTKHNEELATDFSRLTNAVERKEIDLIQARKASEARLTARLADIHHRDGQIAELRETLSAKLREVLNTHVATLAKRDAQIGELHAQLETHLASVQKGEKQIEELHEQLKSHLARVQRRDEQIAQLREELTNSNQRNRVFKQALRGIEKSFGRLLDSRSFHFMVYTARRFGLVSRTARVCVEAIKKQLTDTHKALKQANKARRADRPPSGGTAAHHTFSPPSLQTSSGLFQEPNRPQPSLSNKSGDEANKAVAKPTPSSPAITGAAMTSNLPSRSTRSTFQQSAASQLPTALQADIVICINNALDDLRRCLCSILANPTRRLNKLLLVNDGSDDETTAYLRGFAVESQVQTVLLENPQSTGYTRAANRGLVASEAEYVILLNSDTVVTPGWIERLIACGESDPAIGIVGPLSNAASWQSVPERFSATGDWAVNDIPASSLARTACAFSACYTPLYPKVPLINGFCFVIKRKVIDSIELLDEALFPKGYGEENDYCLRAAKAGFSLAVADDCYVFHAKSKSYSHETRRELARQSGTTLRQKYGAEIDRATAALRESSPLTQARAFFARVLDAPPISILFLMNFRGFGGGITSIVQEANGLRELDAGVQVAIRIQDESFYYDRFPTIPSRLFFVYESRPELIAYAGAFDIVVATLFTGVRTLKDIVTCYPRVSPCYYIQDYEPKFFAEGDSNYQEAIESYTLIPRMRYFAKTQWLCETVAKKHGVQVDKVKPSIDRSIFFAEETVTPRHPFVVCGMVRPHTAHRSPQLTFDILRRIKLEFGDKVEVRIFGVKQDDIFLQRQPRDFEYQVLGILDREGVARLLREAYLFIDASTYQAFGRTGLEAMACGCATILPREGGVSEYAIDGVNTLLAASGHPEDILRKVRRYLEDPELRSKTVQEGLDTASRYNIEDACISELRLFESVRREAGAKNTGQGISSDQCVVSTARPCQYKFRITILSSTTNIHGGTKRLLNIAQRLHLRGHHVTFVRHFSGRELDWFRLDPPLREIRFDHNSSLAEVERRLPDGDILLTYGNNRAARLLDGLSRRKGIKYLLFMHLGVHDRALDEANAALPNFHKLSTTHWIAGQLADLGTKATPIGFGVDSDQFYPSHLSRPFRVGTLLHKDEWKRSTDVIEAFKIVKQQLPQAELVAFGQVKNPELEIECEYHFDPDQQKLRDIYSSCSAWVTSSLWEGIGMCSVEAMLCKTPLITTDTGGSRDFCHEQNSILVEKNSPPSIAAAIIRLLTDPAYGRRLAEHAVADIKRMDWDKCIDRLESSFLADAWAENPTVISQRKCELTIGIPIHNQAESVRGCLASIYANTTSDFEILLLDDASDTQTRSLVREAYRADPQRVRYLRNETHMGFTYSYNRIISNSCGRYICLLNPDTIVTRHWDRHLIDPLKTNPEVAITVPSTGDAVVGNRDPDAQELAQIDSRRIGMSYQEIQRFAAALLERETGRVVVTEYLNAFCMMLNNEIIPKVGFFDEKLGPDSREETGFIERVQSAGYHCDWVKYAYVHCCGTGSLQPPGDASTDVREKNTSLYFNPKDQQERYLLTDARVAFLYAAKYSSSTRKRTFEVARKLRRYLDIETFYLPEVTSNVFRDFDIFILQRIGGLNEKVSSELLNRTMAEIEKWQLEGKLFFYDIDDFVFDAQGGIPRHLMKICDGVIASTPYLQELAGSVNPRTFCLKNGIDYDRFRAAQPASLAPTKFHILCASLGAVGQTALSQVSEEIQSQYPDTEMHLFRNESYCQTLPHLTLHPPVVLDELFAYIKSADIIVNFDWPDEAYRQQLQNQYGIDSSQLSDFVNSKSGLKYYNAGAAAKPFVSTTQPLCYTQMIQHGVNGFLADTIDDFAQAIMDLRNDPILRQTVGRRAFEDVLSSYTLDQIAFEYLEFFCRWRTFGQRV